LYAFLLNHRFHQVAKRERLVAAKKNERSGSNLNSGLWIVSKGRDCQFDLRGIEGEKHSEKTCVKTYQLSDIAYYLLSPAPIEVEKRLVGCEIHYSQRGLTKLVKRIKRLFPRRIQSWLIGHGVPPEVLVTHSKIDIPPLKDKALENHLKKIYEFLRGYDSINKRLPQLDPCQIEHIIGICKDFGGNYTYLKLQGAVEDRLKYLQNNISKDVGVLLRKAYIGDGLFEMRGFDFTAFDPGRCHRLIAYQQNGNPKYCVLNSKNTVEYALSDGYLLKYMLLLQQALRDDLRLKEAFYSCAHHRSEPLKLFFNRQLEVDYSKSAFPGIYRDILKAKKVDSSHLNLIKSALNYLQIGISFNYIPQPGNSKNDMVTLISVLHDLRALELLRKNLPQVYSEIKKHIHTSEAGSFYLLDSIEGFNHDE
jgi:hypothetical protein